MTSEKLEGHFKEWVRQTWAQKKQGIDQLVSLVGDRNADEREEMRSNLVEKFKTNRMNLVHTFSGMTSERAEEIIEEIIGEPGL